MESHPAQLLGVLRKCGALSEVLPEVDALYGAARASNKPSTRAQSLIAALEYAAKRGFALPVRYAVLTGRLGNPSSRSARGSAKRESAARDVAAAERIAERLKVPVDCRDAARLAAGWGRVVPRAQSLSAAGVLDLFGAADALRRPSRLDALLETCECEGMSGMKTSAEFPPASYLRAALEVVKGVDAGAIARGLAGKPLAARRTGDSGQAERSDAVTKAIRAKRLSALSAWLGSRRDRR
jgi:tRNA nucleotidyltransferase (CCA-adding enzyme)